MHSTTAAVQTTDSERVLSIVCLSSLFRKRYACFSPSSLFRSLFTSSWYFSASSSLRHPSWSSSSIRSICRNLASLIRFFRSR